MKCSVLVKPETVLVNQISVSVFSGEVQSVRKNTCLSRKVKIWYSEFRMNHAIGVLTGSFGALLLGVGWVGKARLERWDAVVAGWVRGEDSIFAQLKNWLQSMAVRDGFIEVSRRYAEWGCFGAFLSTASGIALALVSVVIGLDFNHWVKTASDMLCCAGIILFCLLFLYWAIWIFSKMVPLAAYYLALLLFGTLLLPYRLTYWLEKSSVVERTFIFVGTLITVVGIVTATA